jgi:hypothetical protein
LITHFFSWAQKNNHYDLVISDSIENEGSIDTNFYFKLRYFEDTTNRLEIIDVSKDSMDAYFSKKSFEIDWNEHSNYWGKITIKWETSKSYVIFSPTLLKWFDLYSPVGYGAYNRKRSGVYQPVKYKEYKTNLHLFNLPQGAYGETVTYYFKMQTFSGIGVLNVRRHDEYINNSILSYFIHGLIFGIILVAAFYNLILYIKLDEVAYLYYSLYVLSFALFGAMVWYYPFNYLWSLKISNTNLLDFYNIPYTLITVFFLLYARSFFYFINKGKSCDRLLIILIIGRVFLYLLGKFVWDGFRSPIVDLLVLMPVFLVTIKAYRKKFRPSKNFLYAFAALYLGMAVHTISNTYLVEDWLINHKNTFLLSGCAGMFLFSLSLGDRFQALNEEKENAQENLIKQMEETQVFKDELNQKLENKVQERTKEIEERNKQLDTFVYRASHDIKGPLRSIIGLSQLGQLEVEDAVAKGYLEHIFKSGKRLDATLADLINVVKMNHTDIEKSRIDFNYLFEEIKSSFQFTDHFDKIDFRFEVPKILYFESDYRLLYSVIQNLIENGINYSDPQKPNSFIEIKVLANADGLDIVYTDNGLGIDEAYHEKIFEMFFKINAQSNGTGLGMYIVKSTLERLGGTIKLSSKEGEGTQFVINFA